MDKLENQEKNTSPVSQSGEKPATKPSQPKQEKDSGAKRLAKLAKEQKKVDKAAAKIKARVGKAEANFDNIKMHRISTKLIRFVAIVLVVLIALMIIGSNRLFFAQMKHSLRNSSNAAFNVFNTTLKNKQKDVENLAISLSTDSSVAAALKAGSSDTVKVLTSGKLSEDGLFAVFVDDKGNVVYELGIIPDNISLSALLTEGTSYANFATNVPMSYISRKQVVDASNYKLRGGLLIGYSFEGTGLVDSVKEATGCETSIYSGTKLLNTTFIDETGTRYTEGGMDAKASDAITAGQRYEDEGTVFGKNMLFTYDPLKDDSGNVIGAIFVGASTVEVSMELTRITLLMAGGALLLLTIICIVLYVSVQNGVGRPINKVVDLAKDIEHGRLKNEPLAIEVHNEAGELARVMNKTVVNLNNYISDISDMLTKMADRDFTVVSSVTYEGDFAAMKTALNDIQHNTRSFIQVMEEAAEAINLKAEHISSAAQTVATGTTEQASTIQELSSTITEISTNVDNNADTALEVKGLSDKVAIKINEQNDRMKEMLAAMDEIQFKSGKIQKIIKAIDDIAFQTNILALNAAVEAARAGKYGKGFAVVADEVRNLAGKSAEAASETNALIKESIASVRNGSDIATSAANSLKDVVEITEDTHALIESITRKSAEQSEALRQVNVAVDQISSVVQQNSAVAEESMASSEELNDKARDLHALVKQYKI